MDKEIQTGLQLDKPRLLLQDEALIGRGIFYGLIILLGGVGGWGSFLTAFNIEVYPVRLIAVGVISCAFGVWRQVDCNKGRWRLSLIGWMIWLAVLVFAFDTIAHGAVRIGNTMLDSYGAKLNYEMPSLYLPYQAGTRAGIDGVGESTGFISVLLLPFFWAMSRMWIRSRNNRGPFGLTGILLVLPMSFSIVPAGWAFGALLLFWCMLLLLAATLGGPEGSFGRRRKKGYRASGVGTARPLALLLAVIVGLSMWGVYLFAPIETYKRPELAENLRTGLREGFGSSRYIQGGQGSNNKEVQLKGLGTRYYTGETMLRVKFDWQDDPEPVGMFQRQGRDGETYYETLTDTSGTRTSNAGKEYLKSFVGTVYTGDSWERMDSKGQEELAGLELRAQNQISRYKHELFSIGRDKRNCYRLSVQNLGANPRCVYIPASLKSGPGELSEYNIEFVDDGYAKSGNFINGTREYELFGDAMGGGYNYFSRVVSYLACKNYGVTSIGNLGAARLGNTGGSEYEIPAFEYGSRMLFLDGYTPVGDDIMDLFDSINGQANIGGFGWPADLWEVPEFEAWEGLEEYEREFLRDIEAYNRFVYEHYTQVPEELEGFLEDFKNAYNLDPNDRLDSGDFRLRDGAECYAAYIAMCFQDYFRYTLEPPSVPGGRDFVEFFLSESHEGYCVHFASAAVLLLRAAGYPARYAEGYVVPSGESGWVDIPDYNAHAWVEVYSGGTGWVPVEVTPADENNPAAFYNATVPENAREIIPTPKPLEERPTLPPRRDPLIDEELASPTPRPRASAEPSPSAGDSPAGSGSNGKGGGSPLVNILWCIAAAAGIIGAVLIQRVLRVKKRERDLGQRDRNAAGLRAYAYLLKLYEKEILCGQREEPPERWKELAEKARYSAHMLSPEELGELIGASERLRAKLKAQLPGGQKALCWLTGLI